MNDIRPDNTLRVWLTRAVKAGEPNVNGHIYSQELLEQVVADPGIKEGTLPVELENWRPNYPDVEPPEHCVGTVQAAKLDEGVLACEIELGRTTPAQILRGLLERKAPMSIGLRGVGVIGEDNIVRDFQVDAICVIPEPVEKTP